MAIPFGAEAAGVSDVQSCPSPRNGVSPQTWGVPEASLWEREEKRGKERKREKYAKAPSQEAGAPASVAAGAFLK